MTIFEREKENLTDTLSAIDELGAKLEALMDGYGTRLEAMTIKKSKEVALLEIDLERISNELGNLRDCIEQFIKEEEEYQNEEA